jgi:AKAP7 2'5' RNA ligase-like domain
LDHFRNEVVFANVHFPTADVESRFASLWTSVASRLASAGFLTSGDADIADFKRHVTILKTSRDRNLKKLKLKKIPEEFYSDLVQQNFGQDYFRSLQLLSMEKPGMIKELFPE